MTTPKTDKRGRPIGKIEYHLYDLSYDEKLIHRLGVPIDRAKTIATVIPIERVGQMNAAQMAEFIEPYLPPDLDKPSTRPWYGEVVARAIDEVMKNISKLLN